MEATLLIATGEMLYARIPAEQIRAHADQLFPALAHDAGADAVSGQWHRWRHGHDLALDVPNALVHGGPSVALHRLGHILLTDFVTRQGIPIPGFSQSGLGQLLVEGGIPKGFLNIHCVEGGIGILALSEAGSDLLTAIHGHLPFTSTTFFDTMVEGSIEVGLGLGYENPLYVAAGFENLLAGVVSAWKQFSIHVDPVVFFGGAASSALIGAALAYWLGDATPQALALAASRSATIGALFSVNPFFGGGAMLGLLSYRFGTLLAHSRGAALSLSYSIELPSVALLFRALAEGDPGFLAFYQDAVRPLKLEADCATLESRPQELAAVGVELNSAFAPLPSAPIVLPDHVTPLSSDAIVLSEDCPALTDTPQCLPEH